MAKQDPKRYEQLSDDDVARLVYAHGKYGVPLRDLAVENGIKPSQVLAILSTQTINYLNTDKLHTYPTTTLRNIIQQIVSILDHRDEEPLEPL